ncbi:MAG: hypothetical protein RL208_269 [Pseudomonadota bacterium]|jgi:hypothetical protein
MEKVRININLYCRNAFLIAFNGILLVVITIFLIYYSKLQFLSTSSVKVLNVACHKPKEHIIVIDDANFFDLQFDKNTVIKKGDMIGVYNVNNLKQECIKVEKLLLRYILLYNIRYNQNITHTAMCLEHNSDVMMLYNKYQALINDIDALKLKMKSNADYDHNALVHLLNRLSIMREIIIRNSDDIYNISVNINDNKQLVLHYSNLMQNKILFNNSCDNCVLQNVLKFNNKLELKLKSDVLRCSMTLNKLDTNVAQILQSAKAILVDNQQIHFIIIDEIISNKISVVFHADEYTKLFNLLENKKDYSAIKFVQ